MTLSISILLVGAAAAAGSAAQPDPPVAVVPVLVGPIQALLAILPGILIALSGAFLALFRWSTVKKIVVYNGEILGALVAASVLMLAFGVEGLMGMAAAVSGFIWFLLTWAPLKRARPDAAWLRWLDFPVCAVLVLLGAAIPPFVMMAAALVVWLAKVVYHRLKHGAWRADDVAAVVTAVILVAVFYGLQALTLHARPEAGAEEAAAYPWPMFRGGPERRGAVPGSPDPVQGGRNWAFSRDCKMFYSSPCVVGNRVYIASTDKGPLRDVGAIYCLDAGNGAVVWKSRPRKYLATFSSPSVAGKYLVVGEGLHFTKDARVVCLDVEQDGKILWTFRTKSHVESSPCIDLERKRVYIGAGDDGYYCLALEPDANGKAKVLWHLAGENYPDAETSPAVHDGKVYFGLGLRGNAVVCVDAETGEEIWRLATPYPVFAPPTIAKGRLFVGMGNGNFIETAEQVWLKERDRMKDAEKSEAEIEAAGKRFAPGGEIWCVDLAAAKTVWKRKTPRVLLSAIAAGEEGLYFATRDGKVYYYSYEGDLLAGPWSARANVLASPALGEKHVYVVSQAGTLFALKADTLAPVWDTQLSFGGQFISSPTIAQGHAYVGTDLDGLVCVGEPRGDEDPIWPGRLGGAGRSGWVDDSPVPTSGSLAWRKPDDLGGDTAPIRIPVVPMDGSVYVGLTTTERTGVVRYDLVRAPGKKYPSGVEAWFAPTAMPVADAAALADSVYLVSGEPGRSGRTLRCLVAGRLWRGTTATLKADLTALLPSVGLQENTKAIIEKLQDGDALDLKGEEAILVLGRANTILTDLVEAAGGKEAVRLQEAGFAPDPKGGTERWNRPVEDGASGRLLMTQQELFIVDRVNGLTCVEVRGEKAGETRWSVTVGSCIGAPAATGDALVLAVAGEDAGTLVLLDAAAGHERWRATMQAVPTTGPICREGIICVGSADGLTAYSAVNGVRLWNAPVGAVEGELVCDEQRIAGTTVDGRLVLVDWVDGHVFGRIKEIERGLPPLFLRDALLYCTSQSVQRYDFATTKVSRWMRTGWMGRITAPLVASRSLVFVPTEKRGLVCSRPK